MALAASKSNIRKKAVEYINSAIEIANSCSLQTMDFSIYTEFVVIFGWDLESLWQAIHKYRCLILSRACNIDALECYRSLLEPCDEAQKAVLIAWFAEEAKTQSATEAWARMNAEDEAKKTYPI
ncbi:hypothetical protein BDR03DRAFT_383871 [Suillus americanus]|nr:hypothetical protein BDR03DRAFT_383871 [Suillus americanus]